MRMSFVGGREICLAGQNRAAASVLRLRALRYSTGGPKWLPKEKGMTLVMGRGEDDLMEKTFEFYRDTVDLHTVK